MGRKTVFATIYTLTLAAVTLIGIEAMASLYSPTWPARALRSAEPANVEFMSFVDKPWMAEPFELLAKLCGRDGFFVFGEG